MSDTPRLSEERWASIASRHQPATPGDTCLTCGEPWPCDAATAIREVVALTGEWADMEPKYRWLMAEVDAQDQASWMANHSGTVATINADVPTFDEPLGPPTTHEQLAAAFRERISAAEFSRFVVEAREQRERVDVLAAERDDWLRRWHEAVALQERLHADIVEALDIEIDEDGEFIYDQPITAARNLRERADALLAERDRLAVFYQIATAAVSVLEHGGDAGSVIEAYGTAFDALVRATIEQKSEDR